MLFSRRNRQNLPMSLKETESGELTIFDMISVQYLSVFKALGNVNKRTLQNHYFDLFIEETFAVSRLFIATFNDYFDLFLLFF